MTYKQGDKVTIQDVNGELVDVTIEEIRSPGMGKIYYQAGKRLFDDDNVVSIPPQSDGDELSPSVECSTRIVSTPDSEDPVNHPAHYTAYPGIEVIQLTEHMNFNLGNTVKYCARAGLKDPDKTIEDLKKAKWYLEREISRLERVNQ